VRRGELTGDAVPGTPVADLLGRVRLIARAAGVRFGGVIVVLPDEDLVQAVTDLGRARGIPVVLVARGALANVLRQGVPGARSIGGNEIFDIRTRLQQAVRFV
jgi:ABC-type sugar transport system substrate-binding protein